MNILMANKFCYPKGGADKYFLDLGDSLRERGHKVAEFCMRSDRNIHSEWEQYFVSPVEYDDAESMREKVRAAMRMVYSVEARRKFERLVSDFRPDVIHVHNIYHQISPSILFSAKKFGIPVVMHVHDYKLLSPNYMLFFRGKIYDRCMGGKYFHCVLDRCFKNSLSKSVLATLEMYVHHDVLRVYEKNVNVFIAPSAFSGDLIRGAISEISEKVEIIPHAVDTNRYAPAIASAGEYFLVYGRLVPEKGFDIALRAYARMGYSRRKLVIVGTGPEEHRLRYLANELGIEKMVDMRGALFGKELVSVIQNAYAVIVPSRWLEVFGLTNIEAMACARPVIGARIGAIPDIVRDKETGLLFTPDDADELASVMRYLDEHPDSAEAYGKNGRLVAEALYSWKRHVERIELLYERVA